MDVEQIQTTSGDPITPEQASGSLALGAPHELRITSHGKMKTFVGFALKFLEENPTRPLVLHTRPRSPLFAPNITPDQANPAQPQIPVSDNSINQEATSDPPKSRQTSQPDQKSWTNIPRLVSVVEIIKRQFTEKAHNQYKEALKRWDKAGRTGDQPQAAPTTLHQYNKVAYLDGSGDSHDDPETRQNAILFALEGKNYLKQKHTPYMEIVLCTQSLPTSPDAGVTYQPPPAPKRKSRATIARARKRARLAAEKLASAPDAVDTTMK